MIRDDIRLFIEKIQVAFVASADKSGKPHLAAGRDIKVLDQEHLVFENWFCRTTLSNAEENPRVAVAITDCDSGSGYQFYGNVTYAFDAALLNGYVPGMEPPGTPQALTRLVVRVEEVMEFTAGMHTDRSLF